MPVLSQGEVEDDDEGGACCYTLISATLLAVIKKEELYLEGDNQTVRLMTQTQLEHLHKYVRNEF